MKLPKKIKIGGLTYKIVIEELEQDLGFVDHPNLTIKIHKSSLPEKREQTLLHEILHSCNFDLDENEVDMLSKMLYQVLKDNKLSF